MTLNRSTRIKSALAALTAAASAGAWAQSHPMTPPPAGEHGRVLSSTAVQTAVTVPRQVCGVEQVATPAQKSGGGAILGAIAGGVIGNAIGHGSGRAAATAVGIVGGAMIGDHIEGGAPGQIQNVERCSTQNVVEYRTTGYNVVYEYAGRQYSVQLPYEPGPWIRLQVTPVAQPQSVAPGYSEAVPATVISRTVVQPAVVYQPVVMPSVSLGFSHVSGHRHHRHHVHPGVGVGVGYGGAYPRHWY